MSANLNIKWQNPDIFNTPTYSYTHTEGTISGIYVAYFAFFVTGGDPINEVSDSCLEQ